MSKLTCTRFVSKLRLFAAIFLASLFATLVIPPLAAKSGETLTHSSISTPNLLSGTQSFTMTLDQERPVTTLPF